MRKTLIALAALVALVLPARAQSNRTTINTPTTIASGNTFQTILPANSRWSVTIQNNNAVNTTDNCYIQFGVGVTAGTATKGHAIKLLPGGSWARYYPYVPSDEIEATCDSTGDTLYVDTQ